jgi:hypothetical protein
MENNQLYYQDLVERIKHISPVLENPEELTQTVIARVEQISANKLKNKIMYITSIVSGAAAVLLFCLLIYETIQTPANQFIKTEKQTVSVEHVHHKTTSDDIAFIVKRKMEMKAKKQQLYSLIKEK